MKKAEDQGKNSNENIARFGVHVEQFIASPIGQYLLNRAEAEREKAINDMKTVSPTDYQAVTKVQNALRIPDLVTMWLMEAIQGGYIAQDNEAIDEAERSEC